MGDKMNKARKNNSESKTHSTLNESKKITDKLALHTKGIEYRIMDTELKGFGIRVPANNTINASYIATTKPQGSRNVKRYSIGKVSLYKAKEAREMARDWIQKIKAGIDPKAQIKKEQAQSKLLKEAFEQYLTEKSGAGKINERSILNYKNDMKGRLSSLMNRQINNLTEELILNWYKKNASETPAQTDRAWRQLNAVLNYQVNIKNLNSNPAEAVKTRGIRHSPKRKSSYITTEQCGNLINEMIHFRDNTPRIKQTNLLLFQLLTGLRERNAYNLQWSQVQLRDCIVFDETKNRDSYLLPLTPLLNDIMEQQREIIPKNCNWVFPNKNFNGPTNDPRKMLNRLYNQAGIKKQFSDHDLRRTFASLADLAMVPFTDIKHLMVHRKGDQTEQYLQSQQIKAKENYNRIAELIASVTPTAHFTDDEGNAQTGYMTTDILRWLMFGKGKLSQHPNRYNNDFLIDVSRSYYKQEEPDEWD